jgi:hypothetical protein
MVGQVQEGGDPKEAGGVNSERTHPAREATMAAPWRCELAVLASKNQPIN